MNASFDEINKKRLRSELEDIEAKSLESDEDLSESKKSDELEIKNLMEQYNEMIAEKKRIRKLKRKEAAPPKKGRLRKLMNPETLESEVKVEENSKADGLNIIPDEENQF